jgi:hypothetical protein
MTVLERRVWAATRAMAATVPADSVPPLRLPAGRATRRFPAARWPAARWLAPAAAAAAVVVVALIATNLAGALRAGSGTTGPNPAAPASGPSAASYVAAGEVPPYYLSVTSSGSPNFVASYAVVRSTATGKILATIKPSVPHGTILAVAAAADDRTFVLDEQTWLTPNGRVNDQTQLPRSFYLLRLNSAGHPVSITRLPMTAAKLVTGFALSPDGGKLAIAVQPQTGKDNNLQEVRVYTLATGAEKTWSANGTIGEAGDDPGAVSWAADGHTLAFDFYTAQESGVWLLNTDRAGGNLLGSDSRLAVLLSRAPAAAEPTAPPGPLPTPIPSPTAAAAPTFLQTASCNLNDIITPDGSAIVCGAVGIKQGTNRDVEAGFVEYSTANGHMLRVFGQRTIDNAGALASNVLWTNASGSVVIGAIPNHGDGELGIVSGNHFTPLALPPNTEASFGGTW